MSGSRPNIKDFVELLREDTKFLCEYPSCSYLMPLIIEYLEEFKISDVPAATIRNFNDYLEDLWNESSSAISTLVPISMQLQLVKKIGKLISNFVDLIESYKKGKLSKSFSESLDELKERWEKEFQSLAQTIQSAIWKYKRPIGKPCERKIKLWSDRSWENAFIDVIDKHGLLNESNEPSYLLRSGYRSFYFFNSADLCHPDIWPKFFEILSQFMNTKVQETLVTTLKEKPELHHILDRYFKQGMKRIIELTPIAKMYGENLGAPVFMSGLASLGFVQRDLAPRSRFGINWLRGPEVEEGLLSVVLDDLAMRGVGVRESVKRLKNAKNVAPVLYLLVIDRSREGIKSVDGIPVLSMMDKYGLIRSRLWIPEILLMSIESPLWAGLDLMTDPIKEICTFADAMSQYTLVFDKFCSLLVDSYEISSGSSRASMFEVDTGLSESELIVYLMNVHILCWNVFIPLTLRVNRPMEFLNELMRFEETDRITIDPCSKLLKEALAKLMKSSPPPRRDMIHRLIVCSEESLLEHVKNKYVERLKLYMGESFELYSEDELKNLVEEAIIKIRERWRREGRAQDFERYEAEWRQDLLEAYRRFNVVFGKQEIKSSYHTRKRQ